jgi:chemotaxis protein MotB
MAGQSNAAPVIIKRKKVIQGGGHHGGAWKVAYADFVTAMMAFFLLMWLLGATTEKQRKGVADYFSPTIPINRISGGGDGAFGGDSVFTEETLAKNGTGAAMQRPTESDRAAGAAGDAEMAGLQAQVEKAMTALGGESMTMEQALRHVVTKVTDEGLVIELFDLEKAPLFVGDTSQPEPVTQAIASTLADVLELATNQIAVNGHVRSYPITLINNPVWDLSQDRARVMQGLIEQAGLTTSRVQRVSGFADRKPVTADHTAPRNNRIEIVLLRRDR